MWIISAAGSAPFAAVTAIPVKCGIRRTDSTAATAIRAIVVLAFAWSMVFLVGSQTHPVSGRRHPAVLILSGLATGASRLCYFRTLQIGDINRVVPIDKLSILVTGAFSHTVVPRAAHRPVRLVAGTDHRGDSGHAVLIPISEERRASPSGRSSAPRPQRDYG